MRNVLQALKVLWDRKTRLSYTIPEFAHANEELLLIVCDPRTDEVYVTYRNKMVRGKIGEKGSDIKVLRNILKNSKHFQSSMEKFVLELAGMVDGFSTKAKFFYAAVVDMVYAIATKARKIEIKGQGGIIRKGEGGLEVNKI